MSKPSFRLLILLIAGVAAYAFFTSGPTNWSNKLNIFGMFGRSVQETQDTALSKAKRAVKQMNKKNLQLEQDIAGLEPGSASSNSQTTPQVPAPLTKPKGTGTATVGGASPQFPQPAQAHEVVAGKVKQAAHTIDRNYREIERTDAALNSPSPAQ